MVTDQVCLSDTQTGLSDSCVSDFEFFLITSQTGLSGLTGILGLSPDVANNGPSYIGTLYQQNMIDSEMVSFALN